MFWHAARATRLQMLPPTFFFCTAMAMVVEDQLMKWYSA